MSQSAESAAYLKMRLALVEARVRALVSLRRSGDPDPDDAFRGLYVSDEQVNRILDSADGPSFGLKEFGSMPELAQLEMWADGRQAGGQLRLRSLMASFGLDQWEVEILMIALAPDLDPRFERLYGYLNDDVSRRRACIGLALELCGLRLEASPVAAELLSRFHADAALRSCGLLLVEETDRPLLSRPLRVPDRVISHLLGDDRPDTSLAPYLVGWPPAELPGTEHLRLALKNGSRLLYLRDSARTGGLSLGASALAEAGLAAVALDLALLDSSAEVEVVAREAVREARLKGAGLVVGPVDSIAGGKAGALRVLWHAACPVILWGSGTWDPGWSDGIPVLVEAPPAQPETRESVWRYHLNGAGPQGPDLRRAVSQYRLTPEQIRRAAEFATRSAAAEGTPITAGTLQAGARAQNAGALERLTRRIEPRAGWADLVLPDDSLTQLKELTNRARLAEHVLSAWNRASSKGRGVSALFAGDSGTGKTMSAEIVAGDLGLDLYVIDLSTVVDKYIGETEKNLERIFVEADRVNAVLLFDEADAIFGKRSSVSDAHDRYANVETAYLLQRIERFDGLAILTTNLRSNIDEAFVRRMDAIIEFPYPEQEDRRRLWEVHLARGARPPGDLDLDFLAAAFRLSGGNISNVVVTAAFLAASEGSPVAMPHLIRATEREYRKLGHLCVPEEFGPYYPLISRSGAAVG